MIVFLIGLLAAGPGILICLIAPPVEWNAGFNKAIPILATGKYLTNTEDYTTARTILKAAALTYALYPNSTC